MNMCGIDVYACEVFARLCFVATRTTRREFAKAEVMVPVTPGVSGVAAALAQLLHELYPGTVSKEARHAEHFVASVATCRPWLQVAGCAHCGWRSPKADTPANDRYGDQRVSVIDPQETHALPGTGRSNMKEQTVGR